MLKPAFGLAAGLAALASLPLASAPAAADWTYGRSYAAPARPVMRLAPAYVRAPDGRPYGWDYYASPYSWAPYSPPGPLSGRFHNFMSSGVRWDSFACQYDFFYRQDPRCL